MKKGVHLEDFWRSSARCEAEFEREKARIERIESKEILDACTLYVEVGTNCPQGGDWGYGGRTYLKLKDLGSVGWMVRVRDFEGKVHCFDQPTEIEILLGGDAEHRCIVQALRFAAKVLERMEWGNERDMHLRARIKRLENELEKLKELLKEGG